MITCNNCTYEVDSVDKYTQYCQTCQNAYLDGRTILEPLIRFIEDKYNEHEQSLTDLWNRYPDGEMMDNDDTTMMDYHEGAVETLAIVLAKIKEAYGIYDLQDM